MGDISVFKDVVTHEDLCINCYQCINYCPTDALYFDKIDPEVSQGLLPDYQNTWDSGGSGSGYGDTGDASLGYSVLDELERRLNDDQVCFYEIDKTTNGILTGTSLAAASKSSGNLLVDYLKASTPMMSTIGKYVTGVGAVTSSVQFIVGVKDGEVDAVDVLNGLAAATGFVALIPGLTLIAGPVSVVLTITATFVDVCNK